MKRIEILLMLAIIAVAGFSWHYYYNTYARPDLPENVAPAESVFSIEKAAPSQLLDVEEFSGAADSVATASATPGYKTRPTTADLMLAKKLAADFLLWPLAKNPDFWLLTAYLRRQNWQKADKIVEEALRKPQPWHFRFAFTWLSARIKFIIWLEQKPDAIAGQVKDALASSLGGFPTIFAGKKLIPGIGYLASDSTVIAVIPAQAELVASAAELLLSVVNESEHFARRFLAIRVNSQRYCQKLCRSANMLLEPPEISERYAAVDYVYQARLLQMSNIGVVRGGGAESARADFEEGWSLPNLPVCSGHLLVFSRNQWHCALHESLDVELETNPQDFLNEAWSTFLLCNPHLNSDTFD